MEAWANMELHTLTLKLVAPTGSGSKTTSTQTQELQHRAVMQPVAAAEAAEATTTSTKDALTKIFATMEASSPIVMVMTVQRMQERHLGVEATTMRSSTLLICAALAVVAIAVADKMRETKVEKKKIKVEKKKTMETRNKMTPLNALT